MQQLPGHERQRDLSVMHIMLASTDDGKRSPTSRGACAAVASPRRPGAASGHAGTGRHGQARQRFAGRRSRCGDTWRAVEHRNALVRLLG